MVLQPPRRDAIPNGWALGRSSWGVAWSGRPGAPQDTCQATPAPPEGHGTPAACTGPSCARPSPPQANQTQGPGEEARQGLCFIGVISRYTAARLARPRQPQNTQRAAPRPRPEPGGPGLNPHREPHPPRSRPSPCRSAGVSRARWGCCRPDCPRPPAPRSP